MKTVPPSFITWLLTLTGDPGPIGDLARDVESDRAYDCLPTTISAVTGLRQHLNREHLTERTGLDLITEAAHRYEAETGCRA